MEWVTYRSDVPPSRQARVRRRYAAVIGELASLGFDELIFYAEVMRFRPSRLAMLALMAINREVLFRHAGLDFGAAYLVMRADAPAALALPMGMGVKFYTAFADAGLMVSSTFPSEAGTGEAGAGVATGEAARVQRFAENVTTGEGWRRHGARVAEAMAAGRRPRRIDSFAEFVEVARLEEAAVVARFPHLAG